MSEAAIALPARLHANRGEKEGKSIGSAPCPEQILCSGSATQAIAAPLDEDSKHLSEKDWMRLSVMIEQARKEHE